MPAHVSVHCAPIGFPERLEPPWQLGVEPGTRAGAPSALSPASPAQRLHFFVSSNSVIPLQSGTGLCQQCLLTLKNQKVTTQIQYYCFLV